MEKNITNSNNKVLTNSNKNTNTNNNNVINEDDSRRKSNASLNSNLSQLNVVSYDLKSINNLFKELYEKREENYFEKKLNDSNLKSPIIYFLINHCKSNLKELINFKRVKSSNKLSNYYVFVLESKIVFTKDYEDPCDINFCATKNPIIYSIDIKYIENFFIDKSDPSKYTIKINIIENDEIKGNLV